MYTYYHIDRSNSLYEGQVINFQNLSVCNSVVSSLLGTKFSQHGISYVSNRSISAPSDMPMFYFFDGIAPITDSLIEQYLELFRRAYFPDMPSRYQSLFALPDKADLSDWESITNGSVSVYEIYCDSSQQILDASYLQGIVTYSLNNDVCTLQTSLTENLYSMYNYWSGRISDNPKREVLLSLPLTVGKRVR